MILYRIDGKGWRKVTLLKRGMPAKLWQQLEGHGRLLDVLPRFEHAPAEHGACLKEECPHTKREDLGLPNPGCSGEPRVDGDKAAHISGGSLSKTSIGDVPCHVAPPSAAPPDIAAAGGGGGGKPHLATAGGKNNDAIHVAMESAKKLINKITTNWLNIWINLMIFALI